MSDAITFQHVKCEPPVRWFRRNRDLVLQQLWSITDDDGRRRDEWRDVPTADYLTDREPGHGWTLSEETKEQLAAIDRQRVR